MRRPPLRTGAGLDDLWSAIAEHRALLTASGELAALRAAQQRSWMRAPIRERLELAFRDHPAVASALAPLEADVVAGRTTPTAAADALLFAFGVAPTTR